MNFYGGLPGAWLGVPIRTFFAMYREGKALEAVQLSQLADLHLISNNMNLSYYFSMKEHYRSIFDPGATLLPPRPSGPVIESGSQEGMDLMRSVVLGVKRSFGYGR